MNRVPLFVLVLMCMVSIAWPGPGRAQNAEDQATEVLADTPTVPEPVGPPPGEEVMKPTQRGFRFTRKMADGLAQMIVRDQLNDSTGIGDEQKERLAKLAGERAWDLNVRYGRDGSRAAESFYELLLQQAGRRNQPKPMTPDEARQISERIGPGVKVIREFWEGSLEDARPILSDDQFAEYEKTAQDALKMTRRFEEKLNRWSRGEVKENETFMDALQGSENEEEDSSPKTKEYREAERNVRWRIQTLGPNDWNRFLRRAVTFFKFDDAQKASGQKILKQYTDQANKIMTKEWRAKALANRVQEQLQYRCPGEPLAPWAYHLETEYQKMVKPVQDMGRAFRREILALTTPEQRELVLEDMRKVGADHGMSPEELRVEIFLPEPAPAPATEQAAQPAAATEGSDQPSQ